MAVLCKVKHALQVVESGIDMSVSQGHDGGGHNSPVGTISLITQAVDVVGDRVPVLGAGGITDGRGVAAAFMLGAEGVGVGTALLAKDEAGIEDVRKKDIADGGAGAKAVRRNITGHTDWVGKRDDEGKEGEERE